MNRPLQFALVGFLACVPLAALAADGVGTVVMLTGKATALGADGSVRTLAKNDSVFAGDLVNSGLGSYVNLRFADGAFFLLRPETRFQIEDYDFATPAAAAPAAAPAAGPATPPAAVAMPRKPAAPAAPAAGAPPAPPAAAIAPPAPPRATAPLVTGQQQTASGSSRAFFRLVKGGFRSVSGVIGKLNRDDYRVTTPVATIGIRGTSYSARLCEGACEDRDQIATQLRGVGKSLAADETVLVTTVDDGQIELVAGARSTVQDACKRAQDALSGSGESNCGAVFTSPDGISVIIPARPTVESNERSLDPAVCL